MILVRRYAPDGAHTEQPINGELSVGRATDNAIQLPGLLVALHHLRLTPTGTSSLQLDCLSTVGVTVNGLVGQRTAVLMPGDEIVVGGHRIRLGVPDGGGLMLEIRERDPDAESSDGETTTSLDAAGWRMRRPAVIAALVVTVLCLIVPLILRAVPAPPWVKNWVPTDRLWSSGQISNAHLQFGVECGTCHEKLFVKVRDEACLACHEGIAHHGDDREVMAHAGLEEQRCASCHFEHGGTHAVMPEHPAICTDCHAKPDRFPKLASTGAVKDFARAHPPFRVTVGVRGQVESMRTLLEAGIKDHSGLIYPHDLHLDPKGVRGPDGLQVLQCADCHRPGPGAVGFEPLRFERDCQSCHQLDVDIGGLPFRLPHGDSDAVRALLQSAVGMAPVMTAMSEADESGRRRPGERAERGDGSSTPDQINDVFERRVCAKCHEVDKPEGQASQVRHPVLRKTWMPMARFDHAPHQWVSCDTCHAASVSADSDDLLLPQIESCRTCHGGVDSAGSIQSTCIDCHRFHQAADLSMSKFKGELANGQTLESEP